MEADFPLPASHDHPVVRAPRNHLRLARVPAAALFPLTGDARFLRHLQVYDGCPFATLESPGGDILFHYGWRALFALSADHDVLRCGFPVGDARSSERVLLDTVLWTISLERGFELLHASGIRTARGVVALAAASGGGKSTLAAECLRRGASLFADDVIALELRADGLVGHPGPATINLPRAVATDAVPGTRMLAELAEERWLAIDAGPQAPAPLTALVLLRRVSGERLSCTRVPATNLTLMPLAITLPHMTDRERVRFDIFGELAARTPVFALTADPSVPATVLADVLKAEGVIA